MKKNNFKIVFGILMSATMFVTSCKKAILTKTNYIESSALKSNMNVNVSGDEWFKSIAYADGIMTSKINSLKEFTPEAMGLTEDQTAKVRNMEGNVIAQIKSDNPTFLTDYKLAMESGDPVQIQEMMDESHQVLYSATKKILDNEGVDLDQEIKKYSDQTGEPNMVPNMFALIIVVVIALAIAVNLTYQYTKVQDGSPNRPHAIGTITSEILAAEVANI